MYKKKKHYFKEGDTVAHIDKLSQQMTIEKLLITVKDNPDQSGRKQRFFHGIKCHWFDNKTQEFQRGTFHKYELVPWDMAETESQAACRQWIYDHSQIGIPEE